MAVPGWQKEEKSLTITAMAMGALPLQLAAASVALMVTGGRGWQQQHVAVARPASNQIPSWIPDFRHEDARAGASLEPSPIHVSGKLHSSMLSQTGPFPRDGGAGLSFFAGRRTSTRKEIPCPSSDSSTGRGDCRGRSSYVNTLKTDDVAIDRSAGPPPKHFPPGPPQFLPTIAGTSFPGFRTIFQNGECDADDFMVQNTINTKKRCYSCFRIPSLAVNPETGTLHAFAEARRGDLGDLPGWHGYVGDAPMLCPDVPDTTVAYKRSTDGGASCWGPSFAV